MLPAVVVTYKKPLELKACLASLEGQVSETFVKDNAEDNILYTKAINVGLRKYAYRDDVDYILVCCDDVTLKPNAVSEMAAFLDCNPKCGIAMPIQVGQDGETVNCGGCTAAFPYGRHVIEPLTHELYKKPFESFWANGAVFLVRTQTIRECGLLDESMLFICSDADYSFTIRARGWSIYVVPTAIVTHEADGALKQKSDFIDLTKDYDALYFMKKWITGGIFRELSAEGPTLTAMDIEQQFAQLNYRIREMTKER